MGFLSQLKESLFGPSVDYRAIVENGAKVIDVRSVAEFKTGHKNGSMNIPLPELQKQSNRLKGKEVVLVCRSGARAEQAKRILAKQGIIAHNAGSWRNI